MDKPEIDTDYLHDCITKLVISLLDEGYEPPAVCIALASHAARLGLDSEADEMSVVGALFLPIVHQLLETGRSDANDETAFDEGTRVTNACPTLQ
jgi:hypothetical protein